MGGPTWIAELLAEARRPRIPFAVLLVALVLLFATAATAAFGPDVAAWVAKARPWIVVVGLFAAALLVYDVGHWLVGRVALGRGRSEAMKSLGTRERLLLRTWMERGTVSGQLDERSGVSHALAQNGILVRTGMLPQLGDAIYVLEPWAVAYLKKHPEVLQDRPGLQTPAAHG